jgi:RNA polymerase sigma-70 factor, ECF subfamily
MELQDRADASAPIAPSGRSPDAFERALAPLWQRAQRGEEAAYRQALAQMAGRVRAYLRRRLVDQAGDVEDLVQEVLLAVHLQRGTHVDGLPVSNWLLAITRYKLIDHWRRQGQREVPLDEADEIESLAASDDGSAAQARRDVGQLLQRLPEAQRRAIELLKIEGLTAPEAAREAGVTESAIKVQAHRGLKRLAQWMRGSHEDG